MMGSSLYGSIVTCVLYGRYPILVQILSLWGEFLTKVGGGSSQLGLLYDMEQKKFSYWNQVEFHFGDKLIPHTTIAKTISHVVA